MKAVAKKNKRGDWSVTVLSKGAQLIVEFVGFPSEAHARQFVTSLMGIDMNVDITLEALAEPHEGEKQ